MGRRKTGAKCHILFIPTGTICPIYRCKVVARNYTFHISRKCTWKLLSALRTMWAQRFYAARHRTASGPDRALYADDCRGSLLFELGFKQVQWLSLWGLRLRWSDRKNATVITTWYLVLLGLNKKKNCDDGMFHHCLILPRVPHYRKRDALKSFAVISTKGLKGIILLMAKYLLGK